MQAPGIAGGGIVGAVSRAIVARPEPGARSLGSRARHGCVGRYRLRLNANSSS